jgi:hypothetical protein
MDRPEQPTRDRLITLVADALALADGLGLTIAGIHLDAARVELAGPGTVDREIVKET